MAEAKAADCAKLRCETTCTIKFLREITRKLENSTWCCSWEILDAHGRKVAAEIPDLDIESTQDPPPPSPPDRPTVPAAKNEESAARPDLELAAFRLQVKSRKRARKEARILVEQFFAEQLLVPRCRHRRLGGRPSTTTRRPTLTSAPTSAAAL